MDASKVIREDGTVRTYRNYARLGRYAVQILREERGEPVCIFKGPEGQKLTSEEFKISWETLSAF